MQLKNPAQGRKPTPSEDQQVIKLAKELLNCATFTATTLKFIEDTFGEVMQQLVRRLFVPVNVLFVASLSRFWFCLRYHLLHIIKTYDALRPYLLVSTGEQLPQVQAHLPQCYHGYLANAQEPTQLTSFGGGTSPLDFSVSSISKGASVDQPSLSKPTSSALSNVIDFGVPVQPSAEQLISRQKDFFNAVIPRPILSREAGDKDVAACGCMAKHDGHVTKCDDHVTRCGDGMTEEKPVLQSKTVQRWQQKNCNQAPQKNRATQFSRRNRIRLVKVLTRLKRNCGITSISCYRRTPYGVRRIWLSRVKYVRHQERHQIEEKAICVAV